MERERYILFSQEPNEALGQSKKTGDQTDEDLPEGASGLNGQLERPNAGLQVPEVDTSHSNEVPPYRNSEVATDDAHQGSKVVTCASTTAEPGAECKTQDFGTMVLPYIHQFSPVLLEIGPRSEFVCDNIAFGMVSLACQDSSEKSEIVTGMLWKFPKVCCNVHVYLACMLHVLSLYAYTCTCI